MAAAAPLSVQSSPETPSHAPQLPSVKTLAESAGSELEGPIPIIDFSLLTFGYPDQRSKVIQDLGKACQEWGFFMLVNHGVPESMMKAVLDGCNEFFNLTEEEKLEFSSKDLWHPIRFGSMEVKVGNLSFWRDFLKLFVHPQCHFPSKPEGFSDATREYCERIREVARELLKGISESLGLEECYIEKAMDFDSGFQIFNVNFYPPCPQPELGRGIPPHSDHGLLTLLMQNDIGGLQIQHKGQWFNINPLPNSFVVNIGDHLQILSNDMYKSVVHRAVVNNKATRISIVAANGPSLDTVVSPAPELVDSESRPPAFLPMKFKEYIDLQQSLRISGLAHLRSPAARQATTT